MSIIIVFYKHHSAHLPPIDHSNPSMGARISSLGPTSFGFNMGGEVGNQLYADFRRHEQESRFRRYRDTFGSGCKAPPPSAIAAAMRHISS